MPKEIEFLEKWSERFALHVAHYEAQSDVGAHAPSGLTRATIRDLQTREPVMREIEAPCRYSEYDGATSAPIMDDVTYKVVGTQIFDVGSASQRENAARRWYDEYLRNW